MIFVGGGGGGLFWEYEEEKERRRRREKKRFYPHASFCAFCVAESDARDAGGFFVEEDDVGDGGDFGAFVPDVFFDLQDRGGIFLLGGGGEGVRGFLFCIFEQGGWVRTSNSLSVNMCFKMTTLSQRELVSWMA